MPRALAWLAALGALACTPAPGAVKGVLVGLTTGRSLWIAWPNDTVRVVADKPFLVVPRNNEMWLVGVVSRCSVDREAGGWVEDSVFIERNQAVYTVRAGDDARVRLGGVPCEQAEQEVLAERARAFAKGSRADSARIEAGALNPETFYCNTDDRRVTFASDTVLSIERRASNTEFCNPAKYSTWGNNIVTRFGSSERILLRPLLPDSVRRRMEQAFSDTSGCGFTEEDPSAALDSSWAIRRQRGEWAARRWIDGPIVCRGGQEDEEGEPLPRSLTGEPPLPIAWDELVRQLPNVGDATASPAGDYLLAQRADSMMLFRITDGQLGPALMRIHVGYGEELVVVRWATADEERRWSATLPNLAAPRIYVFAESGTSSP